MQRTAEKKNEKGKPVLIAEGCDGCSGILAVAYLLKQTKFLCNVSSCNTDHLEKINVVNQGWL
jgi:hypothetical protein